MDVDVEDRILPKWNPVIESSLAIANRNTESSDHSAEATVPGNTLLATSHFKNCPNATIKKEKARLKRILHISSVGVFLNTAAYYGLINLQSSLNLRDGLGTTGLAIGYVASLLWALLITPLAIESLGPRNSLILSELTYIGYCAANYYPSFFTLIPGAVLLGFGEACLWASMSVIVTYCGEQYWLVGRACTGDENNSASSTTNNTKVSAGHEGEASNPSSVNTISSRLSASRRTNLDSESQQQRMKSKDAIVCQFFSRYFSIVKTSQVVGNLVSYITLYTLDGATVLDGEDHTDRTAEMSGNSSSNVTYDVKMKNNSFNSAMCGIHDCAASFKNASPETLSRYLAKDPMSVNILISLFLGMHIIAVAMHFFLLDPLPKRRSYVTVNGESMLPEHLSQQKQENCCRKTANTLTALFRQMMSLQQLLVSPMALYFGLLLSYSLSEFTRAFVSCPLGVEDIGLVMTSFGASSVCSAFLIGKVVHRHGRNPLYALAVLVDLACFASNAFWVPQKSTEYGIYFIAVGFGFNAGLWEPLINSTYAHYFPENTSVAFSLWNFWAAAGLFVGYTLSSTVCLAIKLYILLCLLVISMLCYAVAEIRICKSLRRIST